MRVYRTNIDLLMDLLELSGPDMTNATGADKTLLAQWRGGKRRIMPGRHWIEKITDVCMEKDTTLERPVIAELMKELYLVGAPAGGSLRSQLAVWLTASGQTEPDEAEKRAALYVKFITRKTEKRAVPDRQPKKKQTKGSHHAAAMPLRSVAGLHETRETLALALDYLMNLSEPAQIIFVCPDGLDMITREEDASQRILGKLLVTLQSGHTLNVVLRTDFRMSDVASFAGPWLTAHLMGHIKSWYYDDFRQVETDKMLLLITGHLAIRVSGSEPVCETFTDAPSLAQFEKECRAYLRRSVQHFQYHFFNKPENYLRDAGRVTDAPAYLFQRLPHFSIGREGWFSLIGLNESESAYLREQFAPMFISPDQYDAPVYHMFCMDAIEEAMDKPKHMHFSLQSMLGRRSYMSTQMLVDQLVEIKRLLKECKNYRVCFMSADTFDKMVMEVGAWGNIAAIGWIPGKQSAVTKNHFTVAALHGYCGTVWERIPNPAKSKGAANRALGKLLGRAVKFGYSVSTPK